MTNAMRGEVSATVAGQPLTLCLTLGALAEIETALGAAGMAEIGARLPAIRAAELAGVLGALARGGGHKLSDAELLAWPADVAGAVAAIAAAFRAVLPRESGPAPAQAHPMPARVGSAT
jgi:Phage tail tube protein, GTA-gp10